jgi:serine/threonine protein kinase/tetratricopeptide (TPR) repeat protein
MALSIGEKLGPYEIRAPIGKGGMGEVWKAHDPRLNRDVAVKVSAARFSERFEREAKAIAALNHPNICQIYDVGPNYLVMEFVEGSSIAATDNLETLLDLAMQIADGMAAAHALGIVHRDLKPGNILVSRGGRVKILDFGLALVAPSPKRDGDSTLSMGITDPGMIVGTVAYMSPEQARGELVDARSDLWSLGVILYEIATRSRPFVGATAPVVFEGILGKAPVPVRDRNPKIPIELERIIVRLLEKDREARYQSVADVRADLKRVERDKVWARTMPHPARSPERVASIAVLAFTDMSATKDQDWFCDGIAEEILNALTPLKGLKVAARTSAFSFKGKNNDLSTIGEKLKVATVLEGSVRRAGDRVRITVQLSDVQDGYQLWSERYDRDLKDIFDVQDEIAKAIAERLRVTLAGAKDDRLVENGTANVEAYQLYLKGRGLLDRRGANVPTGLDLLRKAVEVDPGYSLAWASVADAFTVLAYSGAVRGSATKPQAMAAAARSIELDPRSAAGHNALACATLLYENDRTRAGKEFERALELSPGYVSARCWYALHYCQWACGKFEQGIAEARRALDIDPLSSYVTMTLAACLCTAGGLDESIETARRAVQQDHESFVAHWMLGVSLGTAGRFEEAAVTLERAAGMSGRHTLAITSLAGVFGQWGKRPEAAALHRELMDRASLGYIPAAHLAITADATGQREEAIAFARRAWNDREPPFVLWARHFPQYHALRSDPRFDAILREMDS